MTKKENIKTVYSSLGLCGFGAGAHGVEVDVDTEKDKILRIRPLKLDRLYSKEHMNLWTVEARGTTFEPVLKAPLSPFPLAYKKRVYSPNRIPFPMKRVDWDPNGERNTRNRGKSKFVRISWDEATDIIAAEIRRCEAEYGLTSVLLQGDGHGESKVIGGGHGCHTLLFRLLGDYTLQVRTPDSWEGWYWGGKHVWGMDPRGSHPQGNLWLDVSKYTETMLFWGCDLETTSWGWVGMQPSRMAFWFTEMGMKQVYVCPDCNYGAAVHADKWIPVLPNTDTALQFAIAYTWITESNYDMEYVASHVTGFEEFKAYVLGEEDGVPKTPKWAAPICGVPSYTIKALARNWARKVTAIAHVNGGGYIRSAYSTEPARMEICLMSMQGLGKPGRSVIKFGEWNGNRFCGPRVVFDHDFSKGARIYGWDIPRQSIPKTLIADALLLPEGESMEWWGTGCFIMPVEDQFVKHKYPIDGGSRIHMIWTDAPCWTACWNNGNKFVEALRSSEIECIVAQHQWLENDTLMADIILPINTKLEELDLADDIQNGNIVSIIYQEPAIAPLGESKTDFEAVCEVARKLGVGDQFTMGWDTEGWMRATFDAAGVEQMGLISFDELKERGYYVVPFMENFFPDEAPGMWPFYFDQENNPLQTPTGKLEFVSTNLKQLFPDDEERPPMPHFIPYGESHQESKIHPRAERYPYLLMSNHPRWRVHAELDDVTWLREIESCKIKGPDGYMYEPVWINPVDAKREGIKHGDIVKLYNERGAVLGGAYVTEKIIPGALSQDHGARVDYIVPGEFDRSGSNNLICPSMTVSKNAVGEVTNNFLVGIEKVDVFELAEQYPEAFSRVFDEDAGLICEEWIIKED